MTPWAELERLETVRARTLDLVAGLSQEDLDRRPASGGWSVGEILDHLLKAEEANRRDVQTLVELARSGRQPYIRRALTPEGLGPAFIPRSLFPLLSLPVGLATLFVPFSVREALVRNRLLPASASNELQPRRGREGEELRKALAASVCDTRSLLAANAELDFHRMLYQHPFLGVNNVPQILRLTAAHEERHQDQIRDRI
jgi:hypothetical protein